MAYEEMFERLTVGISNLTLLFEGEGTMPLTPLPPAILISSFVKLKGAYFFGKF